MTVSFVRPDIADMVLCVFERSVHPELIETLAETRIPFGRHTAVLRISGFGHVLEIRSDRKTITEVATSRLALLPSQGCAVNRRLIGYRTHLVEGEIRYQCSYQLDIVAADVFLQLHRELEMDARKSTLAVALPGSSSASPDCLSLLKADLIPEGIVVHSFHTFPDHGAILRIQSLFETREKE